MKHGMNDSLDPEMTVLVEKGKFKDKEGR